MDEYKKAKKELAREHPEKTKKTSNNFWILEFISS
jgi:hypothetical protein